MLKAIIMATLPIFQVMYDNSNSTGICTVWNYIRKWKYESDFTRPFVTMFTRTRNGNISWARLIQLKHSLSLVRFILVLFSYVWLDLASGHFPWGFHPKLFLCISQFPVRIIFPVHDILDLTP
jgi:hypothetical protein